MIQTVKRPRNPTPMFRQYFEIKDRYPDCLLLFRCGDFYEMYGEDAERGAELLEIALTSRDGGGGERIGMAGFPYHGLDNYLRILIRKGVRVAVCEQLEDPSQAKGLVKRDVTRVITSGTVTDLNLLEQDENNYLLCVVSGGGGLKNYDAGNINSPVSGDGYYGVAFCDVSTGEFRITRAHTSDFSRLADEIFRIRPSEVILGRGLYRGDEVMSFLEDQNIPYRVNEIEINHDTLQDILKMAFPKDQNGDEKKAMEIAGVAAAELLRYLNETQKTEKHSIYKIEPYHIAEYMALDATTWRNLELTHTIVDRQKKGTLLWVMDQTKTAMGARMLRSWLERPLLDPKQINARLDAVEELLNNYTLLATMTEALKFIFDLERISTRVVYGNANARDLLSLRNSISHLPKIKNLQVDVKSTLLTSLLESLDTLDDIHKLIEESISEDPPVSIKEGHIIKSGYNAELDELREIRTNAKQWIANLENIERERTGIKSLKVKFNNVFGYFIEVTKPNLHLVPQDYIRKQTIAGGERFISPELKEYESKVLGAEEKIIDLEYKIFLEIRDKILEHSQRIQKASRVVANLDCLCSLAMVARQGNYCRPLFVDDNIIEIRKGRHPVVEKVLEGGFVPNDTFLGDKKSRFHIITGPNMSGKSTYLRQVGLIVIMAQMGSFIPAQSAKLGIVDRVFTRVGASDNLHLGKSTFMMEMSETANIIRNATRRSLILLDEIGRGTSTYDGMSLAWSVSEFIHNRISARTLFATHFHELTQLADYLDGVSNFRVDVKETNKEIIFLHKIVPGGTDKSYGIYVAKLAGMPTEILTRAREILDQLENGGSAINKPKGRKKEVYQLTFFDMIADPLTEELRKLDPDRLSPREALDKLYEWKRRF